ncbi:MAG: hypothetical protein IJT59_02855 [Desulfovibrionaceae bacterium]|nr:hypothetical protein [Desulfovibrionaceae bacterium]
MSVAAAKTKAPKALYSSISSAILLCNPKTKKTLTNIDALRKGISGAPTEFAANPKKKVAGSHDEILNVINARKKQTANNIESDDLLGAW